jgi:PST family polysaccharide transporter
VLLIANLAEMAFPFVRNILLARLLSQENFGVAVSLAMIVALVEIGFDFGIPVSAVRYTATDDPKKALAVLHTLQLTRAVMVGALIIAMSPVLAVIFKSPHATSAYVVVGACAMLRGFGNLGVKQAMRDYIYWPNAVLPIIGRWSGGWWPASSPRSSPPTCCRDSAGASPGTRRSPMKRRLSASRLCRTEL